MGLGFNPNPTPDPNQVPEFLVEELRKTGSRSVGSVADLARELQRSQARAVVLVRDRLELGPPSRASTLAPPTSLGRSLSIAP